MVVSRLGQLAVVPGSPCPLGQEEGVTAYQDVPAAALPPPAFDLGWTLDLFETDPGNGHGL